MLYLQLDHSVHDLTQLWTCWLDFRIKLRRMSSIYTGIQGRVKEEQGVHGVQQGDAWSFDHRT